MKSSPESARHCSSQTTWPRLRALVPILLLLPVLAATAGCQPPASAPVDPNAPTEIAIGSKVIRSNVQRLGINISGQSFYDSGQMLRDLTFRNPGFEGEIWQTILQCKFVIGDACADNDEWSGWPKDFAKGGSFEFFYGASRGQMGSVSSSSVAASSAHQGVWINFGRLGVHPAVGDFYILRMKIPGNAPAGWRTNTDGGATVSTEMQDLSPQSPGKQALKLDALGAGQSAGITSDVDTWETRSFVQLKGNYTLSFRAKGLGGRNEMTVSVTRQSKAFGNLTYLTHLTRLTPTWQDYKLSFLGEEDGRFIGAIAVSFNVQSGSVLLDDASLTEAAAPDNPTAFRNAVVDRLRELKPGFLRYMDNGTSFGSSFDNLIALPYARQRAGYSEGNKEQLDIPIGIHEFLVLCQAVKADPWISLPAGMSTAEMQHLIEYLAGPAASPYGAKRAALGQSSPWSGAFKTIHLELGNETWNAGSFPGGSIAEPKAYATRTGEIFAAARTARYYDSNKFDLIMNGWVQVPWWNEQELSIKSYADTIDVAPYTFNPFNDGSNSEAIFGPMFAEPEAYDSRPTGAMAEQARLAAKAGIKLAVYEVNLGAMQGKASQAALDQALPSVGGGISVAEHMLLMLRDNGVMTQAFFCLPEFSNGFDNPDDSNSHEHTKLWGSVVDMGGESNRVRPTFLAEQLVNSAIADRMVETIQSGANPTWDQPESTNGKIHLRGAHLLQSFAFTDGSRTSLLLFNLSRSSRLPVRFIGTTAPHGKVEVSQLTSKNITDNNEDAQTVATTRTSLAAFNPQTSYSLPPFSMTVLTYGESGTTSSTSSLMPFTSSPERPSGLALKP